jgi:exopolysaccharide production protein ExoZ
MDSTITARLKNWLKRNLELSRGGEAVNVRPMEGMRGFAVFLVFLVHYVTLVTPWIQKGSVTEKLAEAFHIIGNSGVDLFFVLSGFLIYGSLIKRKQPFWRYLYRRIERIYPTFLVVFAVYLCLSLAVRNESKIPGGFGEAAIYIVQNLLLLPGLFPIEPMITVAWSLSYEMFYYLAVPVAVAALGLRERSPLQRAVFFILIAIMTAAYCAAYGGHVRLVMFISGILLFEALEVEDRVPSLPALVGFAALVLGMLGTLLPMDGSSGVAVKIMLLFVAFFTVCLACFRNPANWLGRSFCWTPLRWLGNMSYSYYLLHGITLKAAFLILSLGVPATSRGPWFFWTLLPVMFAVTLLPAVTLFVKVERPYSLLPSSRRLNAAGNPEKGCLEGASKSMNG